MFGEILTGSYERWHGLDPRLTLEKLAKLIGPVVVHAPEQRNRIATRYLVSRMERRAPPFNLEAWIPFGSRQVAIVEVEDPVCVDLQSTLDAMGVPETILEDQRLSTDYLVYEFVFPARGINLSIGKPLDSSVQAGRRLLHVRLFSPMSLQSYVTEVGEPKPAHPHTNL